MCVFAVAVTFIFDCSPPLDCSIDIAMGFDISQRTGAPGEMLISGHAKLQSFLPEIVHYISSIQGLCCIGPAPVETLIGFRVTGEDGNLLYDFSFEAYSEDVVKKVMTLNLVAPTRFNTAMLESFKEKFQTQSGAGVKVKASVFDPQTSVILIRCHRNPRYTLTPSCRCW